MEKNFYQDDFEHFLKDATDNFRMYPSKRVWHSIYNDLHPSRRWPSLAVCLLMISAILFIGVSNNNSINHASRLAMQSNLLSKGSTAMIRIAQQGNSIAGIPVSAPGIIPTVDVAATQNNLVNIGGPVVSGQPVLIAAIKGSKQVNAEPAGPANPQFANEGLPVIINSYVPENVQPADEQLSAVLTDKNITGQEEEVLPVNTTRAKPLATLNTNARLSQAMQDRAWMEDHAFYNKPQLLKNWRTKASWQYYVTPSVGFRTLEKNNELDLAGRALIATNTSTTQDLGDMITQSPAINLEAGATVMYNLSRRWRIKTGFQLNYTNYIINAYQLEHPAQTTILLNDLNTGYPTVAFRSSSFGNNPGSETPKKLNNNTLQLSVPVGADFRLAGNKRLKWYAGATIQPTLVTGGHAYMLSSDAKNYIEESSALRKYNLNAGVETFLSYRTRSGIILNAGPQLRYQLLSTYNKEYTYTERLYNLGLKIGMSTSF